MNILFVSESLWMSGVVFDLHILAEGLSRRGHNIYAVDPGEFVVDEMGEDTSAEFQSVSRVDPEAIVKLRSPRLGRKRSDTNSTRMALLDYVRRYRKVYLEIEEILKKHDIDVVVLYSAARCGIQAVKASIKYKVPVVFRNVDMLHKLWPTKFSRTVVRGCERYVYSQVDRLAALTPSYADYMVRMGARRGNIDILPFPLDLGQFHPASPAENLRRKWRLDAADKVILFIGGLYDFGSLTDMVREFPRILDAEPHAKLLIVGDGPLRPSLEELVDELDINKQAFIAGPEPFSLMPDYISLATICVSCFPVNEYTKDIFSAKVVQYLACGKATVAPALPGTMCMLDGPGSGVVYTRDASELADEMISLLAAPERRTALEVAGLAYVRRVHSADKIIVAFEGMLTSLVEGRRSNLGGH